MKFFIRKDPDRVGQAVQLSKNRKEFDKNLLKSMIGHIIR